MGGNYVVGFVLFLALIAIQFLVVSHGAVRTAEVTARFTLDALPGKQMAIDADMNAGLIDEQQARKRRQAIAREAEFYGAMDGAARFNQRDSMATILITAINIVAGLLIGVFQQGADLATAIKAYTILTVGDGLVTMIPSLLVSVAGGMVLTRASSSGALDQEVGGAIVVASRNTLWIACGVLVALALIPGLPKLVLPIGSWRGIDCPEPPAGSSPHANMPRGGKAQLPDKSKAAETAKGENLASLLKIDELTLEIGFQLIPMVDEKQGGQMLNRVRALRRHLATELGFIVPPVHITDNLRLKPREYVVSLRGRRDRALADRAELAAGSKRRSEGTAAAWHRDARARVWRHGKVDSAGLEEQALASGYSVVDQTTVIGTHLGELIRRHAHELLGRQEVKRLLDSMNESHPKLVEELVPEADVSWRGAACIATAATRAGLGPRPGRDSRSDRRGGTTVEERCSSGRERKAVVGARSRSTVAGRGRRPARSDAGAAIGERVDRHLRS